jgi:5-methylcytosine-specific restriction endonuclease McrA
MSTSPRLTVELVPTTCFYINLRSILSPADWDLIRRACYKRFNSLCAVCGGKGERHPVEAHEEWCYDDGKLTQTLVDVVSLCPDCHQVKHLGLASIRGKLPEAFKWLKKVNGWGDEEAKCYVQHAFQVHSERGGKSWTINVDKIKEYGVAIPAAVEKHNQSILRAR